MITQFLSNVIVCGVLNLLLEVINGLEQSSLEWHLHTEHSTSQCMHTYVYTIIHSPLGSIAVSAELWQC